MMEGNRAILGILGILKGAIEADDRALIDHAKQSLTMFSWGASITDALDSNDTELALKLVQATIDGYNGVVYEVPLKIYSARNSLLGQYLKDIDATLRNRSEDE